MLEKFQHKKCVILDGGMGTYLEKIGYKGITPEIANIENPEIIEKIHLEYCENGAEIILTNTFGCNRIILMKKKLENSLGDIIKNGVEIGKKVKNKFKNVLIAGDIGPTGEILQPYGTLTIDEAEKVYSEIGKIFKMTSVDFLVLETFQDLEELKIAYGILKEKTNLYIVPCLTFTSGKEYRTLMGQKIDDFVKWAEENKIELIGSNCGVSSKEMIDIVKNIKNITNLNLWIKPNAGKPQLKKDEIIYSENIEEFGDNCLKIVDAGVKFIGGCCGTTPLYIKHLKTLLVKQTLYENC